MNIFVYSDESGVFDSAHNDLFVFGGIVFLDTESKDINNRKYIHAEKTIKDNNRNYNRKTELKASLITHKEKYKLIRSLSNCYKFGVVINQKEIHQDIFANKKDKQRFLDYVYKIAIKRYFEYLIRKEILDKNEEIHFHFFIDEHSTATNGRYELQEALEREFRDGTFNSTYSRKFAPVFKNTKTLSVNFCDSASMPLIRAADIIANNIYYRARTNDHTLFVPDMKMHIIKFPPNKA